MTLNKKQEMHVYIFRTPNEGNRQWQEKVTTEISDLLFDAVYNQALMDVMVGHGSSGTEVIIRVNSKRMRQKQRRRNEEESTEDS